MVMAISSESSRQQSVISTDQPSLWANQDNMDIDFQSLTPPQGSMDLSIDTMLTSSRNHPYHHPTHFAAKTSSTSKAQQHTLVNSTDNLLQLGLQIVNLTYLDIHPPPALLVCLDCQHGITPKTALEHIKTHNIVIASQDKLSLIEIIETIGCINNKHNFPFPSKLSPPILHLKVSQGWGCCLCNYCSTSSDSFKVHFSKTHPDKIGSHASQMRSIHVQQFFQHSQCFEVTPALANLEQGNSYELYLKQYAPTLTTIHLFPPPNSVNEVSPLLRITQWHEHLKDFIDTHSKVQSMLTLVHLPTLSKGNQDLGKPLELLLDQYLKKIRLQANSASIGLKCLLMECPR